MRRHAILLATGLLLAGCGAGAATTPAPPVPTAAPPDMTTPAPSSTCTGSGCPPVAVPEAVGARVTFDGTTCDYTGPVVIALPAMLTIEFAPTSESYGLALDPVLAATTRADVDGANADEAYGPAPGKKQPAFMLPGSINRVMGTMTWDTALRTITTDTGTFDQYAVTCIRAPWAAGAPPDQAEGRVTGALIRVVEP